MMDDKARQTPQQRIIELESLLAHQQRLLEHLDETLRNHELRLANVERQRAELVDQMDRLHAQVEGGRSAEDEKPPHY